MTLCALRCVVECHDVELKGNDGGDKGPSEDGPDESGQVRTRRGLSG